MINQKYFAIYAESIKLKDLGLLKSSLKKREEATKMVQDDLGYYSIGKANEAILLGHHIGDGIGAYETSVESLKNVEAFAKVDVEWKSETGVSVLLDIFGFIVNWAESYDEAILYCEEAENWVSFPQNHNEIMLSQLKNERKKGTKWWELQYAFAQNFYSRVNQEIDKGKYAGGMAILHCIIDRACREQSGYEMEEEIFDILDDFLQLSFQAYDGILQKFVAALPNNSILEDADGPAEQFIIFLNPIKYWIELMPDCPEKWKQTFQAHYERFMGSPFPIYPEKMKKIGEYFPDAITEKKEYNDFHDPNSEILSDFHSTNFSKQKNQPVENKHISLAGLVIFFISFGVIGFLWYWALSNVLWWKVILAIFLSFVILNFSVQLYHAINKTPFNEDDFIEDLLSAEAGNTKTMVNVGLAYWRGEGIEKDLLRAEMWLRRAASSGDMFAEQMLKRMIDDPDHPF